ncbi:MAG: 3'(2'),5'-bisphosphate nucleotidase CysQ [Hyphomicrobiales bacterium]|nr:3'(2'),5'-bisphosphate nucleotidase CysQ [Hyphomicrobiales bacterium]
MSGMLGSLSDADRQTAAETFGAVALAAGRVVMDIYAGAANARQKADSSPVCDADERAEASILAALAKAAPGIPVIAEESVARGVVPACGETFILVDPLDGTREFLARNGEFTVNLALIERGAPVAGAVYAPALEKLWIGGATASLIRVAPGAAMPPQAERRSIQTRAAPADGLVALCSRSHGEAQTEAFLRERRIARRVNIGSSLKFCLIAEGEADVYPRFGPTMEWDIAAGDAVLRAAGGCVLGEDGAPMVYGKRDDQYRNGPFVAWGRRS